MHMPEATVVGVEDVLPTVPTVKSYVRSDNDAIAAVRNMGMPQGLAEQFVKSTRDFSYRFWIIDNSGSMGTQDGHRVVSGPGGREGMVSCSRWEELGQGIRWHARLAVELGAYTEFRLLNQPSLGPGRPDRDGGQDGRQRRSDEPGRARAHGSARGQRPHGKDAALRADTASHGADPGPRG